MVKIDKSKLTLFYKRVFEGYENEEFPLNLLGKYGWMTFKDKQDLFNYYLQLSILDKQKGEV